MLEEVLQSWHQGQRVPATPPLASQLLLSQHHLWLSCDIDLYCDVLVRPKVQPQLGLQDMHGLAFCRGELELKEA